MFSSSYILKKKIPTKSSSSGGWSLKNWLIGSKGLTSLVTELNVTDTKTNSSSSSAAAASSSSSSSVQKIVNRYRKLLIHSSSWELLSPQQILTCLGASSIPLYSVKKESSSSSSSPASVFPESEHTENNDGSTQHQEASNNSQKIKNSNSSSSATTINMPSSPELRVVEAEFAENVWSAALPSLSAFSVTMTSAEAASVVRNAHRLSVALPPSLLRLCAERFICAKFIPSSATSSFADLSETEERDAQIFEVFVTEGENPDDDNDDGIQETQKVRDAIVVMIRTAHAFSAQASLLRQQQSRHCKLAQNTAMLSMIQNAVEERSVEKDIDGSSYSLTTTTSKRKQAQSPVFPPNLYELGAIAETLDLCKQATMNLIETSCSIISSRDGEDNFFRRMRRERENGSINNDDQALFLERREALLALFSHSSLCISIEAISLLEKGKNNNKEIGRNSQTCFVLVQELIRRIQGAAVSSATQKTSLEIKKRSNNNSEEPITLQMIRDTFALVKNICETTSSVDVNDNERERSNDAQYGISLANDLYVTLTHKLGTFVRRLAFAGPGFYEEFVNAAIEMEKAAHVIQTFHNQLEVIIDSIAASSSSSSSSVVKKEYGQSGISSLQREDHDDAKRERSDIFHQSKTMKSSPSSSSAVSVDSIFKGERHSLDGPLVVESVANYFDHILQLFDDRDPNQQHHHNNNKKKNLVFPSSSRRQHDSLFLRNFKDVNHYSLLSNVAPLCIGSLVVWSDIEDVRTPAVRILSKSLRYVSPTHLVRICQLIPRLRTSNFIGGTNKNENNHKKKKLNNASKKNLDEDVDEVVALDENEYANFIDEVLAAVYVSYKDLSCVGCCVALRSLAELSVVEKERLTSNQNETNYDSNANNSPYVMPIGALSLCVQALTARVSELLEIDARKKSSSPSSSALFCKNEKGDRNDVALSLDQRLNEADSVVVRYGYQTKLILEHIGVSLSMLGMLPGLTTTPSGTSGNHNSNSNTNGLGNSSGSVGENGNGPSSHREKFGWNRLSIHRERNHLFRKLTFRDTIKMMETAVDFEKVSIGAIQSQKNEENGRKDFFVEWKGTSKQNGYSDAFI